MPVSPLPNMGLNSGLADVPKKKKKKRKGLWVKTGCGKGHCPPPPPRWVLPGKGFADVAGQASGLRPRDVLSAWPGGGGREGGAVQEPPPPPLLAHSPWGPFLRG